MNLHSMVPEYSVVESEKIPPMEKLQDCIIRDYSQVVVDLVELSKAALLLEDLSVSIGNRLQELVLCLQAQQSKD